MNLPDHVIRALFSKLKNARWYKGSIKACCFEHDEATPSFMISEKEGGNIIYYCFGCGSSGTINRVCKKLGIDFYRKFVFNKRSQCVADTESPLIYRLEGVSGFPMVYDYFIYRGISEDVCRKFNFRFDFDNTCAVMPVTTNGHYLGYIRRNLDPSKIRYEIYPGMQIKYALWGYDQVDPGRDVYITEGIIDAAIFWSQGYQAVALCNKTYKTKLDLLGTLAHPICVPDNQDPESFGIFNSIRKAIGGDTCYIPREFKDAGDFVLNAD